MKSKRTTPIPERKTKIVGELSDLVKNKKTILVASIKGIPSSQFQEIVKKLRDKAVVKVPKKNLIYKAIGNDESRKGLKEQITESVAILFSDLDCFDLSLELIESKNPAKAKAGQIAPFDIEIPAGPTELVPGPAISELGALGIQIQIEKGKINIKEAKVIAKEGAKISSAAAELMGKLDIKPFFIGFTPVCGYDTNEKKLYLGIKISREEALDDLKDSYSKAMAFAVEIGVVNEDTIKFLISKAGMHEKALENLINAKAEVKEDVKQEEPVLKEEKEEIKVEENKETEIKVEKSEESKESEETKTKENNENETQQIK
jgi:large subunit ribosomal protein L10